MRIALTVVGAFLVFCGSFFALQGAGIIMWPADSFMLAQTSWVAYGLVIALAGAVLLLFGRRIQT